MDYDKMVNIIVEEVLGKLQETPKINSYKKRVVIFEDGSLDEFYDLLGREYNLISYDKNIQDCDVVIIPKLTLGGIANLASLTCSSDEEEFIITMLMKGRKIYVIENGIEYRKYKDTAPKQIYNKYLNFEKQLINYGIEILNEGFYPKISTISNVNYDSPIALTEKKPQDAEVISKKVITEDDIRRLQTKGANIIIVCEKSILTPLAKDFIRMNHIEIMRRSG